MDVLQSHDFYKKPDYRKVTVEMLRLYPIYINSLKAEKRVLMPSMSVSYQERVIGGYQEFASPTEEYGIMRADRRLLVERIDYALTFLGENERDVIEQTYFKLEKPNIDIVYQELKMSQRTYYRIKKRALEKIELALRLIGLKMD